MSDKNKIILKDKGWSQMATILDKEIPQEKRSMKLILWFFVAGLVVLGIVYTTNIENRMVDRSLKESIAQVNIDINEGTNQDIPLVNTQDLNDVNLTKAKDALNLPLSGEEGHSVIAGPVPQENIAINLNNKEGSKRILIDTEKQNKHFREKVFSTEIVKKAITIATSSSTINVKGLITAEERRGGKFFPFQTSVAELMIEQPIRDQYTIDKLPEITRFINSNNGQIDAFHRMSISQNRTLSKPARKDNNYYAFAGGNIGVNQNGLGYQVGAGKRFGASGLGFFVEGGYGHFNYKNKSSNLEAIVVDFAPENSTGVTGFDISESPVLQAAIETSQNKDIAVVNNLSYVFLSAGIEKKISDRIYIIGGLSYARYLEIENPGVNFTSSDGSFQSDLNRYNISKTTFFDNGDFKKYELSSSFGIGYQINNRITASVQYRLGLTNLSNLSQDDLAPEVVAANEVLKEKQFSNSIFRKNVEVRVDYSF
ncbi:MAG: hypothetical protein ACJA1A_002891 [Saprospiraceae bacterium]|jgi:hypothetical protein